MMNHLDCTPFDLASFLGQSNIPDDVKYRLIQNRIPESSFKYPDREYNSKKLKGGSYKRFSNPYWLKEFLFLTYSRNHDGLYCLSCTLFSVEGQCHRAKLLLTAPYKNWKDARAVFQKHSTL